MLSSTAVFLKLSLVVLLMVTVMATNNVPQSMSDVAQSAHDEQHQNFALAHHQVMDESKHNALIEDEDLSNNNSDEEYKDSYGQQHQNEAIWSHIAKKRYANTKAHVRNSVVNGGENRLWAIPYRFGKRAAMPYRFGKRAAMPYRFGKRAAAMHFRLGKKSTSL